MGASAAMAGQGVRLRIGGAIVDAADRAGVNEAIKAANARARIEGVEDALNPWLIDEGRALALLAAVGRMADGEIAKLEARAIVLGVGLPVMMTSPVGQGGFDGVTGFAGVEVQGESAVVRVVPAVDCDLAGRTAGLARAALERMVLEVAVLERRRNIEPEATRGGVLRSLGVALVRRFALATAWHENATAAQACRPADAAAAIEMQRAREARDRFAVPFGAMN